MKEVNNNMSVVDLHFRAVASNLGAWQAHHSILVVVLLCFQ
jgi:hypothetical protein